MDEKLHQLLDDFYRPAGTHSIKGLGHFKLTMCCEICSLVRQFVIVGID